MPSVYEGHLLGEGLTFGIVVSRFNSFVTEKLLTGALDALKRHGVDLDTVDVFWTPGAFEIPGIAKRLAESERYDVVLCLGAVIRGATPHFDYVAAESAKGIANISASTNIPVIYGVITTDTIEQALERAGIKAGNKGFEAAIAGIETVNLYKAIDQISPVPDTPSISSESQDSDDGGDISAQQLLAGEDDTEKFTMTGEEIRTARRSLGLTQAEFAQQLGLQSPFKIGEWEREQSRIPDRYQKALRALINENNNVTNAQKNNS